MSAKPPGEPVLALLAQAADDRRAVNAGAHVAEWASTRPQRLGCGVELHEHETPESLVARADAALYDAKRCARNRTALRRESSTIAEAVRFIALLSPPLSVPARCAHRRAGRAHSAYHVG